jgi:hypothetical protein
MSSILPSGLDSRRALDAHAGVAIKSKVSDP